MTYPPPSAATGDYSSRSKRDGTHLPPYPDDDVIRGPGSADDSPGGGHRSSRRPGGLRRLLHRRPPPEATNPGLDAGLESRSAEYRALHRAQGTQGAQRAEQPGISWGSGRPGTAQPPAEEINERLDPEQAAREHLAGLRPDDEWAADGAPADPKGTVDPKGTMPGSGAMPPFPRSALPRSVPPAPLPASLPAPSAAWVAGRPGGPGRPAPGVTPAGGLAAPGSAAGPGPLGSFAGSFSSRSLSPGSPGGPMSPGAAAGSFSPAPVTAPPVTAPPVTAPPSAGTADPSDGEPLYRVLAGLAMRDLTLVESLLQVVEKLESREEDAGQLGLLFRIDHLATRMRRNSENLLVLAGHDGEGRDLEPVPLLDVARAAISEITEYSRAQIASLPDVMLIGPAADDVSHILAELLDNATSKSPESAAVVVRAERTGDGTMVLSVEDAGIGIPADQLAGINMRLGRPPVLEAAATRHMGLYVVGRLAQRHGIRVQLRERPYGGIAAHVILPSRLVRAQPEAPSRNGQANHTRSQTRPGTARPGTARPDTVRPDTVRPDTSALPLPAPARAPEGRPAPPSPAPPSPAPPSPSLAPPVTPRFAPADPSGLPRRTPRQAPATNGTPAADPALPARAAQPPAPAGQPAAPHAPAPAPAPAESAIAEEPGDTRASQIRADLSGFRLGQRAARETGLPEPHHGGGTPDPDAEGDGESIPPPGRAEGAAERANEGAGRADGATEPADGGAGPETGRA